jgi:hypothetical protein
MAWWVPGGRDVVNGLTVAPREPEAPVLIEETVRVVRERNPLIDASQVRVRARPHRAPHGVLRDAAERDMAGQDARAVPGIDDAIGESGVAG